jgi:hypothetical protein
LKQAGFEARWKLLAEQTSKWPRAARRDASDARPGKRGKAEGLAKPHHAAGPVGRELLQHRFGSGVGFGRLGFQHLGPRPGRLAKGRECRDIERRQQAYAPQLRREPLPLGFGRGGQKIGRIWRLFGISGRISRKWRRLPGLPRRRCSSNGVLSMKRPENGGFRSIWDRSCPVGKRRFFYPRKLTAAANVRPRSRSTIGTLKNCKYPPLPP